MESVEQPNDVHEQNTRDFQVDLPFWISAELPQTSPETAGCNHLIFNAARRTDKLWICVRWGLQFMRLRAANPQSISPPPSGESTLSPEATFSTCGAAAYADGGGYLIRGFFDVEEALGDVAMPDAPGFTIGRRPARASFLGVRSLNLVLADFGTLLFCFFLVVMFYSLSFLFCFFGAITVTYSIIRIRANLSKVSKELNELPAFSVNQQAFMQGFITQDL